MFSINEAGSRVVGRFLGKGAARTTTCGITGGLYGGLCKGYIGVI